MQWDKTIDDDLLEQIEKLEGVAHTERIGLGQVSLENRVLTVASVDPGGYRNFTQADVADFQETWDRVAGGEMAIDQKVAKRLADKDGMIRLGSEDDAAPTLHVGAYTPQIPTIDMVVNTAWADDIEMATDNGLLISTDNITPATIRKPLEKLVGKDASVQMLDVASHPRPRPRRQAHRDPDRRQHRQRRRHLPLPRHRRRPDRAGVVVGRGQHPHRGGADPRQRHLPQGPLPPAARRAARGAAARPVERDPPDEYAGCYYPRFIANTTTLSNHSFGLALDLNVPGNGRGTVGEMNRDVVAIFKTWGFAWGGDWRYTDPMHFELSEIKRVG